MKLDFKQKRLIVIGIIIAALSPLFTLIGTPILSEALCRSDDNYIGVCEGVTGVFAAWIPFFFGPILIGMILITIAFVRKKR